uniref:Uncharacterized protein n=1 Tax=Dulem virus 39 TaxID=3145757 RepID=A0AAU8B566_9CAUD
MSNVTMTDECVEFVLFDGKNQSIARFTEEGIEVSAKEISVNASEK